MMSVQEDVGRASEDVLRIPAGVMALLRQSYSTRERVLDWLLAGVVVVCAAWVIWPMLKRGRLDQTDMQPNDRVHEAVGSLGSAEAVYKQTYTYNLPPGRRLAHRVGPSPFAAPRPPVIGPITPGVNFAPDGKLGVMWPPHEAPCEDDTLDANSAGYTGKSRRH